MNLLDYSRKRPFAWLGSGLSVFVVWLALVPSVLAAARDPNTDWFQRAGYGVFVHYLEDLQNDPQQIQSLGRRTSWDECVREFDANRFAEAIGATGAGYVFFTMHQRTRFLIAPNADVHFPKLGVDGDLKTTALAGGEWPWTYEVDLLEPHPIRRLKVTFAPNGYPTQFRLQLSTDRKSWQTVAAVDNHDGQPYVCEFAPVHGQHIRVSALKPDGPKQKGAQMAIAELEVYK